jgi:hypothetical protein
VQQKAEGNKTIQNYTKPRSKEKGSKESKQFKHKTEEA